MFRFLAALGIFLLAACAAPVTPASGPPAATHHAPAPASPTPVPQFWQMLFPGAEVASTEDGLQLLRHAPNLVRYDVLFEPDPEGVQFLSQWLENSPDAWAGVNCGFYWDNEGHYEHMGLLELNRQRLAPVRGQWGGALLVQEGGAKIVRQPAFGLPPVDFGVQGWPLLLWQGQLAADLDAETVARRTAVGLDASGRVLWVVDGTGSTLQQFARRLRQPDIGLVDAVNLDGGASSGLMWREAVGGPVSGVDSLPIPCVITLSPR